MRFCDHDFYKVSEYKANELKDIQVAFALYGCLYCGQIRRIDEKGEVKILVQEGEVNKHGGTQNISRHS